MTSLLALFALSAQEPVHAAAADVWKRQWVGASSLSLELPGSLTSRGEQIVESDTDWVSKVADFGYEDDKIVAQVSWFHAKPDRQYDHEFLLSLWQQILEGLRDGEGGKNEAVTDWIDDVPAYKTFAEIDGPTPLFVRGTLIGQSNNVFAIVVIGQMSDAQSAKTAARIQSSVRLVHTGL